MKLTYSQHLAELRRGLSNFASTRYTSERARYEAGSALVMYEMHLRAAYPAFARDVEDVWYEHRRRHPHAVPHVLRAA